MPYKKTNKKRQKKKNKKPSFRSTFKCGDYHQRTFQALAAQMKCNPIANSYIGQNLTQISLGDTLDDRRSNIIYMKNVQVHMNIQNNYTNSRNLRVVLVSLRGSVNAADTTTWTDIYTDSGFNKLGPSGLGEDTTFRINQDEYVKLYDKTYHLHGSADGEDNSKVIKFNVPVRKYVSYVYNSTNVRKNPMHLVFLLSEEEGNPINAAFTDVAYRITQHFYDIHRIAQVP